MIIAYNTPDDSTPSGGHPYTDEKDSGENSGTVIFDAICAP